jgi:hypothetical protein
MTTTLVLPLIQATIQTVVPKFVISTNFMISLWTSARIAQKGVLNALSMDAPIVIGIISNITTTQAKLLNAITLAQWVLMLNLNMAIAMTVTMIALFAQ